jgi:hypothetical protein
MKQGRPTEAAAQQAREADERAAAQWTRARCLRATFGPKISVSRDSFGERNVREDSGLIRPVLGHREMEMGRVDMAARPI